MDGGLYIGRIAPDLGQTETARAGDQIGVQRVQRLASLGPCQAGKSTSIVRWFSESKLHWGCSNHVWIPNATGHRIPYKTRGFSTTIIFPEPPRFDIVWWFWKDDFFGGFIWSSEICGIWGGFAVIFGGYMYHSQDTNIGMDQNLSWWSLIHKLFWCERVVTRRDI